MPKIRRVSSKYLRYVDKSNRIEGRMLLVNLGKTEDSHPQLPIVYPKHKKAIR